MRQKVARLHSRQDRSGFLFNKQKRLTNHRGRRLSLESLEERALLSGYDQIILGNNPIAYYRLGELSGTTAIDRSGHGLDGTYLNGVTLGQAGAIVGDPNTAAAFDGQNDLVQVGDSPLLQFSHGVTFEAWVYPTDASSDEPVVAKEGTWQQTYWFGVYQGHFGLLLNDGSQNGWALQARSSGSISNLRWQYIASTWDGTTWRNYLDGQLVQSGTWTGQIATSYAPLTIGSNSLFDSTKFNGTIDEVAIYDHALSAEQITSHYYARYAADPNPPVIVGIAPLPAEGQAITAAVERLMIQTSKDLMPTAVNNSTSWELRGAGPDAAFGTGDDVLYALSATPQYTTGTSITLNIASVPLPVGSYRFTAYASALQDFWGNALDGNNDGMGGDNFVRNFQVVNTAGVVIEAEPNDTLATATAFPLPLVEDPVGSGCFVGRGLGSLNPVVYQSWSSDVDYWSFQALAGDVVSVSVDTPDSDLNPSVELRNAADSGLVGSNDEGPGADAFISHYAIASSGTYYVRIAKGDYWSGTTGSIRFGWTWRGGFSWRVMPTTPTTRLRGRIR